MVSKSYLLSAVMAAAAAAKPMAQGMSPLSFKNCAKSGASGTVTSFEVDPNPPQWGELLNLTMNIDLKEPIGYGSNLAMKLKTGIIDIDKNLDLCTALLSYGHFLNSGPKECPIPAGSHQLSAGFRLPSKKPFGLDSAEAEIKILDVSGKEVACQKASIIT